VRRVPLVDENVAGDVDPLPGPAEVVVDVRKQVAEVIVLLARGQRSGRRDDRHQGDADYARGAQATHPRTGQRPPCVVPHPPGGAADANDREHFVAEVSYVIEPKVEALEALLYIREPLAHSRVPSIRLAGKAPKRESNSISGAAE
jgi:hypothetical protein